ncbi:DNA topoisomerase 2-associated protein pat1 [Dimargaris verticillata]|uniref:DNA topoisomerase 2-associated protein pat1 n=1 Tax=Dimargaris verticillata TaxID=2761393 RepID=A0A9W8B947_9FUNG|nr:DNA topoisomerase 2-associated protein pat1 [Dimargaris verticillata]
MANSFFGFNAQLPSQDAAKLTDDIDLRLERIEIGPETEAELGQLDEGQDDLNDETFGADAGDIHKDFDFSGNTGKAIDLIDPVHRPNPSNSGPSTTQWGSVPAPAGPPAFVDPAIVSTVPLARSHGPTSPDNHPPRATAPPKVLSLEEVEQSLIQEARLSQADHQRRMARDQRRQAREARAAAMFKYNNLMTRYDKDYVARIQMSQLVTDDPYADDFYYQMYTVVRQPAPSPQQPPMLSPTGHRQFGRGGRFHPRSDNGMHKMQQQIQRMVNDAKRKPKGATMTLEGALGTIALHSVRNPKQAIQMARRSSQGGEALSPQTPPLPPPTAMAPTRTGSSKSVSRATSVNRRAVLMRVEKAYATVLKLEALVRRRHRFPGMPTEPLSEASLEALATEEAQIKQQLWQLLQVDSAHASPSPGGAGGHPHPLVEFLSVTKGKKLIPRIYQHLDADQVLRFVMTLVANFESLDVCRSSFEFGLSGTISAAITEENQLFMNAVLPPMVAFINDAPLSTVNTLLNLFIDRNNVPWVARSKVGLSLLTVFISRGEVLRLQDAPAEELAGFDRLYAKLFGTLQSYFANLFPTTKASLSGDLEALAKQSLDEVYVWQFLAAISIGASPEQQHILVSEVRDKVMEQLTLATKGGLTSNLPSMLIANVNLFLHALGLDASQLLS